MAKRLNRDPQPTTRITFMCDCELAKKMDDYCDKYHISRTAFICMACAEKVTQDDVVTMLPDMVAMMSELQKQAKENESQIKFE